MTKILHCRNISNT